MEVNPDSLKMTDSEYHGAPEDMGHRNMLSANIRWEQHADSGMGDSVAMLAIKFRGFTADEGARLESEVNSRGVKYAKYVSHDDTATVFALFIPSSSGDTADTVRLHHPELGNCTLPPALFSPHGIYSVELRKTEISLPATVADTVPELPSDTLCSAIDSIFD